MITQPSFYLTAILVFISCFKLHSANTSDILEQTDVVLLGDSNLWIGGDDCDKPQGWNYWWRENYAPRSCVSYARSGATWTNTSVTRRNTTEKTDIIGHDNVIYNQVCRLIENVDSGLQPEPGLIMIAAGTNDAWFHRKRPGIFSDSPSEINAKTITALRPSLATSLARSVMLCCQMLRTRFPDTRIVLLTPMPTTAATAINQKRVSDIIVSCAKILELPVIRLDRESGIDMYEEKISPRLTTDGTHTSIDGARQVAAVIGRLLMEILKTSGGTGHNQQPTSLRRL